MIKEDHGFEFDINGERSSEPSSGLNFRALVWAEVAGACRACPFFTMWSFAGAWLV